MLQEITLRLLKLLEQDSSMTQLDLAQATGVSLGKVNFLLKARKDKGHIKRASFSQIAVKLHYNYTKCIY